MNPDWKFLRRESERNTKTETERKRERERDRSKDNENEKDKETETPQMSKTHCVSNILSQKAQKHIVC